MMAQNNDTFTVKEIAISALKGLARYFKVGGYDYRTIFHSPTGEMSDTKMFDCLIFNGKAYEFKFTRKRDLITDERAPFEGVRDKNKTMIMQDYADFVKDYYPMLHIQTTKDRVFVNHCGWDYEITFVEKKGVKIDE